MRHLGRHTASPLPLLKAAAPALVHSARTQPCLWHLSSSSRQLPAVAQICGSAICMLLVDTTGRRTLMIQGSLGCGLALLLVGLADFLGSGLLMIMAMCAFILAFSASYAGIFWVLLSELFSMPGKAPGAALCTAVMFAAGGCPGLSLCCRWSCAQHWPDIPLCVIWLAAWHIIPQTASCCSSCPKT